MESHSHAYNRETETSKPPSPVADFQINSNQSMLLNGSITVTPIHRNSPNPTFSTNNIMTLIPLPLQAELTGDAKKPQPQSTPKAKLSSMSVQKVPSGGTKKSSPKENLTLATVSPVIPGLSKAQVSVIPNGATITPLGLKRDLEPLSKQAQFKPIAPKKKESTLISVKSIPVKEKAQPKVYLIPGGKPKKPPPQNPPKNQPPTKKVMEKRPNVPQNKVVIKKAVSLGTTNQNPNDELKRPVVNGNLLTKNPRPPGDPPTNGVHKGPLNPKKPIQNGGVTTSTTPPKMLNGSTANGKILQKKKAMKPVGPPERIISPPLDTELNFGEKQEIAHPLLIKLLESTSNLPMKDFSHALETLQTVSDAFQLGHRVTVTLKKDKEESSFSRHELYTVHYDNEDQVSSTTNLSATQVDGQCDSVGLLKMLKAAVSANEATVPNVPKVVPPTVPITPPTRPNQTLKRKNESSSYCVAKKTKV